MVHLYIYKNIPASLISKPPPGFFGVISLACHLFGHSKLQIVGSSSSFPSSQPPPTPSSDSSTQPRNKGVSHEQFLCRRWFMCIFLQQRSPVSECLLFRWEIFRVFNCRIFLIGVIYFFPVGNAVAAGRIFPISLSIRLNGTPFVLRTVLCSSASITLCLSHAISMYCVAPSTIQPSTYFLTAHWPLPESNFLLYIISCPLCPDTFGGGKICGSM